MYSTTPHRFRRKFSVALLAIPLLTVMASACSGAEPSSIESSKVSGASTATTRDEYDLQLAKCLRDAGFDVKDPAPGQGITESSPEIIEAAPTCMRQLGNPPVQESSLSDTEQLQLGLKAAACIRERGFDFPDPTLETPIFLPAEVPSEQVEDCFKDFPTN
ncbi:hypothetical protein [Rhodococcus sp. OK302]|uniref:hypothetical protein n=1 Tax=Rhodococcus sp. OK302 TaxID=1882769 RepID=UPI000B93CB02|nr:hypothetical protein [Rhodococcus sp. OK302]OYD60773.1 hypothetical protein BDB13_5655 [Rhodococcus sp. OK302]